VFADLTLGEIDETSVNLKSIHGWILGSSVKVKRRLHHSSTELSATQRISAPNSRRTILPSQQREACAYIRHMLLARPGLVTAQAIAASNGTWPIEDVSRVSLESG
jgi:hypothetical protein